VVVAYGGSRDGWGDDADAPGGGWSDAADQEQVVNSQLQQPPSTKRSDVSRGAAPATAAAAATVAAVASRTMRADNAHSTGPGAADRARRRRRLSHADWSTPPTDGSSPPATGSSDAAVAPAGTPHVTTAAAPTAAAVAGRAAAEDDEWTGSPSFHTQVPTSPVAARGAALAAVAATPDTSYTGGSVPSPAAAAAAAAAHGDCDSPENGGGEAAAVVAAAAAASWPSSPACRRRAKQSSTRTSRACTRKTRPVGRRWETLPPRAARRGAPPRRGRLEHASRRWWPLGTGEGSWGRRTSGANVAAPAAASCAVRGRSGRAPCDRRASWPSPQPPLPMLAYTGNYLVVFVQSEMQR